MMLVPGRESARFETELGLDGERLVESVCQVVPCFDLTPADLVEHMSDIYKQSWQDLASLA
jgi:hypothetical protein